MAAPGYGGPSPTVSRCSKFPAMRLIVNHAGPVRNWNIYAQRWREAQPVHILLVWCSVSVACVASVRILRRVASRPSRFSLQMTSLVRPNAKKCDTRGSALKL